jgi:hypothetical protein
MQSRGGLGPSISMSTGVTASGRTTNGRCVSSHASGWAIKDEVGEEKKPCPVKGRERVHCWVACVGMFRSTCVTSLVFTRAAIGVTCRFEKLRSVGKGESTLSRMAGLLLFERRVACNHCFGSDAHQRGPATTAFCCWRGDFGGISLPRRRYMRI